MPLAHGLDSLVRVTRRVEQDLTLCCQASRVHTITESKLCVLDVLSAHLDPHHNSTFSSPHPKAWWEGTWNHNRMSNRKNQRESEPSHALLRCFSSILGAVACLWIKTDVRRVKSDPTLSDHLNLILRALTNLESMLTRLLHSLWDGTPLLLFPKKKQQWNGYTNCKTNDDPVWIHDE